MKIKSVTHKDKTTIRSIALAGLSFGVTVALLKAYII